MTGINCDQRRGLLNYLKAILEKNGCGCLLRTGEDTRFLYSREWARNRNIDVDLMIQFNESMGWMNCDHELVQAIEYRTRLREGQKVYISSEYCFGTITRPISERDTDGMDMVQITLPAGGRYWVRVDDIKPGCLGADWTWEGYGGEMRDPMDKNRAANILELVITSNLQELIQQSGDLKFGNKEDAFDAILVAIHELRGRDRCDHAWTKTCIRCIIASEGGRIIKEDEHHAIVEYHETHRKEYVMKADGWNER